MPLRNLLAPLQLFYDKGRRDAVGAEIATKVWPEKGGEFPLYLFNGSPKRVIIQNPIQEHGRVRAQLPEKLDPQQTFAVRVIVKAANALSFEEFLKEFDDNIQTVLDINGTYDEDRRAQYQKAGGRNHGS